jgi:basic amino acid/polyamine antiporter, APA family
MAEAAQNHSVRAIRKSIPLPRTMGLFSVFLFGAASIGLLFSAFVPYSTLAGMWPGSNLIWILALAVGFCLIHAFTYSAIGTAVPRSGADYVLASRVISAPLAFASSVLFVFSSAIIAGLLIASISQVMIPAVIKSIGLVQNTPSLINMASGLAQSTETILVGAVVILLVFSSLLFSTRITIRFLQASFILSLLAWGAVLFQIFYPVQNILNNWNVVFGSGSFDLQIDLAKSMGMVVNTGQGSLIAAGLFTSFLLFAGYFSPTLIVSEIKQPGKNLFAGTAAAILVTGVVVIGTTFLANQIAQPEWFSAQSYLAGQPTYTEAMPWLLFYANLVHPSSEITWFVGAAWVISLFTMVQVIFFYSSRIIQAWSQDNLLPESLKYLHPSTRSPIIALLAICVVTQISLTTSALGINVVSTKGFVLATAISQILPVLALISFPFVKKVEFAKASGLVRFKMGPIPLVSLAGLVSLVYLVAVIVAGTWPGLGIGYPPVGFLRSGLIFVGALMWYYSRRWYLRRSEQLIEKKYLEFPVEE